MKKVLNDFAIALEEEDTSGVASSETEYVFYAKLKDPSVLKHATSVEEQEQWTLKIPKTDENLSDGTLRVRKTTLDGKTTYALTIKTRLNAAQGDLSNNGTVASIDMQKMLEVALEATEDSFEMFKRMANTGMIKRRHILPIEGLDCVFEVDQFVMPNGEYSEWVKVDLEVKTALREIPELPDGFIDVIYNQKSKQTPEEAELITRLYDEVFLSKNANKQ